MLRDVFYYGEKPNAHPREQKVSNLEEAKMLSKTEHFWIINEFCNYRNFDWDWSFDFLPDEDVWAEEHNNVWPSPYQKDSGTWLCSTSIDALTIYRNDVEPIPLKNEIRSCWKNTEWIDKTKFDFKWHPDPTDPPYIYVFGTQWQKTGGPIYEVPGATEVKYIDSQRAKRLQNYNNWDIPDNVDMTSFDFSWHPDDTEQPYIYEFATEWNDRGGPKYIVPGATEYKYITYIKCKLKPNKDNWIIPKFMKEHEFDWSWVPHPHDPPYIYQFGTQWQKTSGPVFVVPGAKEVKYVDIQKAKITQHHFTNWLIPRNIDQSKFDFSWHPDETEEAYIYQFPDQWSKSGGPRFIVDGATQVKYIDVQTAVAKSDMTHWLVPEGIDVSDFDFSWHPDIEDKPYIYQFGTQWQKTGGPKFFAANVEMTDEIKYVDILKAKKLADTTNWVIPNNVDKNSFDFSWHPDDTEPPYIYQFPSQWGRTGGPKYIVPDATEIKYLNSVVAKVLPEKNNWIIPDDIEIDSFDFSWHPDVEDKPYIYQFGTQWQKTGGPKYYAQGADDSSEIKYVDTIKSKRRNVKDDTYWKVLIDIDSFDYSWHPDSTEEPYIYVFGNKWHDATEEPSVEYHVPGATQKKYILDLVAIPKINESYWQTLVPITKFDYSWRPHPKSPPYIYVWGNQWNDCHKEPTIVYTVPGATEYKYMEERIFVKSTENDPQWEILIPVQEFDFSWRPDPTEPPFIYVFGNKWNSADKEPTILYRVKDATEYKFVDTPIAIPKVNMTNWNIRNKLDEEVFDFSWRPDPTVIPARYEWGSDGPVYTVPDYKDTIVLDYDISIRKQQIETIIDKPEHTSFQKIINRPMFFIDRGNIDSAINYEHLKSRFPQLQKTRYLNSWVETIVRCSTKSSEDLFWIVSSEIDYSTFDFDYNPNPWQRKMTHVFGTQWTHWGNTYLVNKQSFPTDTKWIKIIEHLNTLNFVKDKRAKAYACVYDVILIDHKNKEITDVKNIIESKVKGKNINLVEYDNSYFNTIKKVISQLEDKKEHYIWVCSSICDYTDFDFSYVCDPFAKSQLHVFPSDKQKFGDTFLIDVNMFKSLMDDMLMLEDYEKVNYNQHQRTKRLPAPIIITQEDTLTSVIQNDFDFPYAIFQTYDNQNLKVIDNEPISLWTHTSKNIMVTSTGGTRTIVPKEAKLYVEKELYDYPYITRSTKLTQSKPLDIVFLSNGEIGADENYEHLLKVTKNLPNKVVRVDGINGRINAYHAAAKASETPWMFTVFAKLKVNPNFDWSWQPDRLQVPKHYIFYATNPVNGLEYGHQAMIAYNKRMTLNNKGKGLDFTLDDEHDVVEINSGVAIYNTDAWSTWRTAFREALKLRADLSDISIQRLDIWLTVASGNFAEYSLQGAKDAVDYYEEVNGDFEKLKLSYDWDWLKKRFNK